MVNRIDRLMAITLVLQTHRVVRAEDLARRFEISERTVYRDVAALGEVGVPIVAEAGVGYRLMSGYRLAPIMFTTEEAAALATAGMVTKHSGDSQLSASFDAALLKIRAVLPEEQRERLDRVEASLAFAPRGRKRNANTVGVLELQRALSARRIVRLSYVAREAIEPTEREVSPIGLLHYLEHWHLIAWCRLRGDFRDFRLDRIRAVTVLAECAKAHERIDLSTYMERGRDREANLRARVWFSREVAERAKRQWSLGMIEEELTDDGSVLTLQTGDYDWLIGWLLAFGTRAQVVEPDELRERLQTEARLLVTHHGRSAKKSKNFPSS